MKPAKKPASEICHIQHSVAFVLASLLTIPIDRLTEGVYRYRTLVLDVLFSTRVKSYIVSNSRLFDENRAEPAV